MSADSIHAYSRTHIGTQSIFLQSHDHLETTQQLGCTDLTLFLSYFKLYIYYDRTDAMLTAAGHLRCSTTELLPTIELI